METEKFELMLDEAQANAALEKGMLYADTFVNKNYLINLDRYPLVELDPAEKSDEYIRLYQIERIVYDVDENANDKLISVYSAFFNIQAAGLLVIKSTRNALGFYIGVRSVDNTSTAEAILEKSFKGNFAGSQIQAIPQEEVQKVLGSINKSGRFGTRQNVSSVSIVPSTRDEDKERFVQGIEKFIDTMKGSEYTAVFIAEPLDKEILEQRKRGLQKIYSGLSPFASTQLSYGENYSKAVSKGMSENFSKTLNDSLTDTTSHFNSRSTSRSHGTSFGFLGIGFNNSTSTGYSSGSSWASAVTRGTSETKGETVTETDTDTTGDSRTITVTSENKSVKYILEKIDQHLARIKNCEAFGLWDIACYFVSENVQTSVVAASTYKALMAGFDSGVENSYVNVWKQDNTENTPALLEYLRYCIHPRFSIPGDDQFFEVESQTVNPCSLISGNEMPYIMGLPHHSVPGVTVLNMAEFGRNVRFSSGAPRGKKVELGQVYHMGEKETARVKLDLESFRSHCFITGSTGSGKSNTTYRILDEMIEHKIPFLVVEPAKGEYKRYYGKLPGIHVYCTNPRYYSMLHINPFRFNQGIHVLEHLDRLIEIFNACWPLYAAMPAILKESFERAYIKCGWDLENSIYIPTCLCGTKLPTTFLNGRGQLKAYCPECDTALSGDTASRQYAFPVIGGPSVGKTCFINMAIDQMMSDVAPARSWKMSFISDTEEKDHALAMKSLNQGVRLMKTELNSLTAYQLMLKLPNEKIGRRIYVYDISGEMFSSSSDVQNNLAYSYANGFIFIIDPLTLNQFAMDVEDKVDLNAYGASSKDFDDILNIMLINLEKMFGLKDKDTLKRNLAVVINKVDIPTLEEKIGETAAQQYLAENAKTCKSYMDARDAVCRNFLEEYGAGNFVRTAEAKFKTVRYFTCSALGHNHEGQPYEGKNVVDPVMWLLQQADSSIKAE